jgi:hypothetical protein
MKASELMGCLSNMIAQHGDYSIVVMGDDGERVQMFGLISVEFDTVKDGNEYFVINAM